MKGINDCFNCTLPELYSDAVYKLEQQQAEIERLKAREYRLTEYMRDVKNYALTLREVSQNAIDEGDVL